MRNAKLWSVLCAAVLLCACIVGVLFTGTSAETVTVPYAVDGTEYASVKEALVAAKDRTWEANEAMEITLSIADTSADVTEPGDGESANLLFGQTTIFRADGSKLPITVKGSGEDASIAAPAKTVACANDYTFQDLTYAIDSTDCIFYAGSGNVVFERVSFSSDKSKFYADNFTQDAFAGWEDLEAGEFVETSITLGEGSKYLHSDNNGRKPFSAVGYSPAGCTFNTEKTYIKSDGTLDQDVVDAVLEEAKSLTFDAATNGLDCADIRPVNIKTTFTVDNQNQKSQNIGKMYVRVGSSPVASSTAVYKRTYSYGMTADIHNTNLNETYVGDIKMVLDGCKLVDSGIFFRGLAKSTLIGNFTTEIHDTPGDGFDTSLSLFQGGNTSPLIVGNYEFVMTGGTLGDGTTANDGYWGGCNTTGTVINRVSGGNIWQFGGLRYQNAFRNTPVSVSDGTEGGMKTEKNVSVRNIITGGTFGGETASSDSILKNGGFFGLMHAKGSDPSITLSICNEISGGTFYNYCGGENPSAAFAGHEIINEISGNPTFIGNYHGGSAPVSYLASETATKETTVSPKAASSVTNYIRGGTFQSTVYGIRQAGDRVTNVISGGEMKSFYGTHYSALDSAKNYIKGGTFTSGIRCTNYGTVSEIVNEFTGGMAKSTLDAAYCTTFDTIKNYFKGGTFQGGLYSCYGGSAVYLGDVYNYISGGTFTGNNCLFGGYGGLSTKSVTNEVSGNPQFARVPDKADHGVYFGPGSLMWPSKVLGNVTTTIKGGAFTNYVFGGGQSGYTLGNIETYIEAGTFERNVYGAGYGSCNTNNSKNYLQTDFTKLCEGTVKTVFGKEDGSTKPVFKAAFYGGEYGNSKSVTSQGYDIVNIVYDADFTGGTFSGASNTGLVDSVHNVIYGGTFYGSTSAICARFGGHKATIKGGVVTEIYGGLFKSYAFGGSGGGSIENSTEGEPAIKNVICGGTFNNFWGASSTANLVVGDVVNEVSGGIFNTYMDSEGELYPNCFSGGNRNHAHAGGNVINRISGGIFTSRFTAGNNSHNTDLDLEGVAPAFAVTTEITGGIFHGPIYANERIGSISDGAFRYAAATLNVTQTEGKPLEIYGVVPQCDTFVSNGTELKIGKDTDLTVTVLTGKLCVNQTEGWEAHDYLTLPATSQYEIIESADIFGTYTADDTILVKGVGFRAAGATIRLSDRLGVRVLLNKNDVDAYGDVFTYSVTFKGKTLAEGTKADLVEYQGYYSFVFDGIGLSDFGEKMVISSPFFEEDVEKSIADLAVMAQTAWAENAKWKAYADAIVEFHNVYNLDAVNTMTPDAVAQIPSAARGAADGVASASATLLMADAAGVRLSVTLDAAPVGAKILVNGNEVDAQMVSVSENTITADLYFAHEYLANEFVVSVQSDAGEHMTYRASIEGIANQLASNENNENKDNAQAFLVYIQKAVACK